MSAPDLARRNRWAGSCDGDLGVGGGSGIEPVGQRGEGVELQVRAHVVVRPVPAPSRLIQQLRRPARAAPTTSISMWSPTCSTSPGAQPRRAQAARKMLASGLAAPCSRAPSWKRKWCVRPMRCRSALPLVSAATGSARGDALQRGDRVGIALDLVARGVERFVGGVGQRRVAAAFAQRALQGQPPQRAEVVHQLRVARRTPARAARASPRPGSAPRCAGCVRASSRAAPARSARRSGANGHRVSSRSRVMARTGKFTGALAERVGRSAGGAMSRQRS